MAINILPSSNCRENKINKKCNHKVGKQYKIREGEWYYGKEKGETEPSKEVGSAGLKTLLQFE